MTEIERIYSQRRWLHGRAPQLLTRLWCRVVGHRCNEWFFDWPYDVPEHWEAIGQPMRDPRPDETLVWMRSCKRDCGCIESANVSLLEVDTLPGPKRDVYDHPFRPTEYGGTHLP